VQSALARLTWDCCNEKEGAPSGERRSTGTELFRSELSMPNLTITIPHELGRAEAKRRIQEQASQIERQHATKFEHFEQRWEGDTLHFKVGAVGQSVSGSAFFTEQDVQLSIALPWMLRLLAGTLKQQIETQGRNLLAHRAP
jgi:hypothetical protein